MKMIPEQHWSWHPGPTHCCEPRERLAAIVCLYPGYVRREQPDGDRNMQESSRNKHLERKTLHGPNENKINHRWRERGLLEMNVLIMEK